MSQADARREGVPSLAEIFFGRLANFWRSRRARRGRRTSRVRFEALENRLLLSADLIGDVPNPVTPPPGCAFHPRCAKILPHCSRRRPETRHDARGRIECHLHADAAAAAE